MEHKRLETGLPDLHCPVGFAVADLAERDQVERVIVRFGVIDVVNMEGASDVLRLVTLLAGEVVPPPNPMAQGRIELRRVADVKAGPPAPGIRWNTAVAVDPAIAPIDQALGFGDGLAAPGTGDGDRLVVPIARAAFRRVRRRPTTCTRLRAEMMGYAPRVAGNVSDDPPALLAGNRQALFGLGLGGVTGQEATGAASRVERYEQRAAAASAWNHRVIWHSTL